MTEYSKLGVVTVAAENVTEEFRLIRRVEVRTPVEFVDWVVDDIPLRELLPHNPERPLGERTFMTSEPGYGSLAVASLHTLLGEGEEDSGVTFSDGRVGLLFCESCGDINCPSWSANLEITADTVVWREIGSQIDYEPFVRGDGPLPTFTFDRIEYDTLIRALLARYQAPPTA